MQLEDMRIFVTTVDARNFTSAASRLSLSKQFVSRRVMALEEALGVRLLIRNTRKLAVTELGQEFYERAKRILGEVAEAEQAMSLRRASPHGLLRVSAPMSFGMVHLSPLVAMFLKKHPDVRFDMELSDRTVDVVGEGFDMAIRIGTLADSTLIAQKLAEVRMVACCSPQYLRRRGTPAAPADLERHDCLLYGHGGPASWDLVVDGVHKAVEVHGPLRANSSCPLRSKPGTSSPCWSLSCRARRRSMRSIRSIAKARPPSRRSPASCASNWLKHWLGERWVNASGKRQGSVKPPRATLSDAPSSSG
jgi:DNA-binding transcriptional LysR family regulator